MRDHRHHHPAALDLRRLIGLTREIVAEAKTKTRHRYFVAFKGPGGFGHAEIHSTPIRRIEDVRGLARILEKKFDTKDVVIINWRRFED